VVCYIDIYIAYFKNQGKASKMHAIDLAYPMMSQLNTSISSAFVQGK